MKTSYIIQEEGSHLNEIATDSSFGGILTRLEGRCNDLILALLLARERLEMEALPRFVGEHRKDNQLN